MICPALMTTASMSSAAIGCRRLPTRTTFENAGRGAVGWSRCIPATSGFRAATPPYRHLDAVIRNFATGLARHEGIWTIPEGYANGTRADVVLRPITERKYEWSFTGQPLSRHADPTSNRLLRTLGTRTTLPRFAFARCHHNVTEQPWRDPPAPSARAVLPLVFKLKLPAGGDPIHLCK